MSITIIFTILKFLKKNWKELALFIIVFGLVIVIIYISSQLLLKKKQIEKLELKVESLETTNEYYERQVYNFSNKAFVKESFTNTTIKIRLITNDFYLNEEYLSLLESYKDDFYK